MKKFFTYTKGDWVIWIVVILLSLFSLLAVYSSTGTLSYRMQGGNTEYYLFKHSAIVFVGFLIIFGTHLIPYTYYSRISQIALWVAAPMLGFTLIFGSHINEASRWITLPIINLTFQTSDFAKVALIMFIARSLSRKQDNIKDFKSAFLPIIAPVLLITLLILPANLSTAAVLFTTCMFIMFIGRVKVKYILLLFLTGILCVFMFIGIALLSKNTGRVGTWKARIENFIHPNADDDSNYQSDQAQISISSGKLLGKGPGNSTQRNFLPHAYSDYIYAIITEEYGLFGASIIVILYLILFYRTTIIVRRSPRAFATLVAVGCSFSLVFQAMINMAVAVHIFPVTGQPLPFISMGGTSIWFSSIGLGIILSVSRDIESEQSKESEISQKLANA
ncbi:MAG: putative peptidoglycan glycosyltransferase FtsW [Bacteroidota bacterium]